MRYLVLVLLCLPFLSANAQRRKIVDAWEPPVLFATVIQKAEFSGGNKALYQFIYDHVNYPPQAIEARAEGTVWVSFFVDADGSVSDILIAKPIGYGIDEEAKRLIRALPKWKPAKYNGKALRTPFSIPVHFVMM